MFLKSSMLWRMVMMLAYFFCCSTEMIFLTMSVSLSFVIHMELSWLIIRSNKNTYHEQAHLHSF
jgi:hypothetical protein